MLTLSFHFGGERRGIPYGEIVEVVALVNLTLLGNAPKGVVGAFNYHGAWVPVVDLAMLLNDRPSRRRWSTRILIVRPDSIGSLLGLVAESATEMIERPDGAEPDNSPLFLRVADLLQPEQINWLREFREPPSTLAKPEAPRQRRRLRHYSMQA